MQKYNIYRQNTKHLVGDLLISIYSRQSTCKYIFIFLPNKKGVKKYRLGCTHKSACFNLEYMALYMCPPFT